MLSIVVGAAGSLAALLALYLVGLAAAAGLRVRRPSGERALALRTAVLIPAHNEASLIGRCLRSISESGADVEIIVVADNCTDETASLALAAGAQVMARQASPRGKGHALRWAIQQCLDRSQPPEAFIILDADSVIEPGAIESLVKRLAGGANVAQAEYLALPGVDLTSTLAETALLLFHRVRLGGLARLGLPTPLVGNGMAFRSEVLRDHPWNALTAVEDLEYALQLRLAGVSVTYAPEAVIRAPVAGGSQAIGQRTRWEGGRLHLIRFYLPRLIARGIARRDGLCLAAAVDLAVPPLGLFAALVLMGATAALGLVASVHMDRAGAVSWLLAACLLALYVPLGMLTARAPARCWWSLLHAPAFLGRKVSIYRRIAKGFDIGRWDREHRNKPSGAPRRMIGGVPIDAVTMAEAVDRIDAATRGNRLYHVCTVNLDFLRTSRFSPKVKAILTRADLNLADGAPVVWLSRFATSPLPERVAGSDLVPLLAERLASRGGSLFLLGAERGNAAEAARILARVHPSLRVGWLEPEHAPLEQMDVGRIAATVSAFAPDILLVALSHPKQELFIDMYASQLGARVAIGVGCTIDLIAGRRKRAPRWMQRNGLEWAFRVAAEPRRLARRYLADSLYLGLLLVSSFRVRSAASEP